MKNLTFFEAADVGPRDEQQDSMGAVASKNAAIFVLSDGAGGHRGGSSASKAAVESVKQSFLKNSFLNPEDCGKRVLSGEAGGRFDPEQFLSDACLSAHRAVADLKKQGCDARSTLCVLLLCENQVFWLHVGDSRIYRLMDGMPLERTKDHSVVQVLVDDGEIQEEEMGNHPDQGRVLKALGMDDPPKPSIGSGRWTEKASFLLCSDGFWERTSLEEITSLLDSPSQEALQRSVKEAVRKNGPKGDNVSAMAVWSGKENTASANRRKWHVYLWILVFLVVLLWLGSAIPQWFKSTESVLPSSQEMKINLSPSDSE